MSDNLPVSLEFDDTRIVGYVSLTTHAEELPNLHEYFLAPSYMKNDDGSTFTLIGYGLIHRDHLPTKADLDRKYGDGNY